MPELPEVEIHARMLRGWLVGRQIDSYAILDSRLCPEEDAAAWDRAVRGREVTAVRRQAKYLLIDLEGSHTMVVHLRMTGKFLRDSYAAAPAEKPTRLVLQLDDGSRVRFVDFRRFGRVWVTPTGQVQSLPELVALGPDALLEPVSDERWREVTSGTSRSIKALMMDQRVLGGLGNICAIEILYRVGIAPDTPANRLTAEQVAAIVREIPTFLEWSIEQQSRRELLYLGEPGAENVFSIYARRGEPCSRCGTTIARTVIAGRGTYYCPGCQK